MRAVNLIPAEQRGGRVAGRSGIGVYAILGALALLVVMGAALAVTSRTVSERKATHADLQEQALAAEARLNALATYTQFANMSSARLATVTTLVDARFDWAHTLREVARVIPRTSWLMTLRASADPSVAVDGGAADPLRGQQSVPALELIGCASSHEGVSDTIAAMRQIDGVLDVALSSTERSAGADGAQGCGSPSAAKFSMTVFLNPPQATAAAPAAVGGTTP